MGFISYLIEVRPRGSVVRPQRIVVKSYTSIEIKWFSSDSDHFLSSHNEIFQCVEERFSVDHTAAA